MYDLNVAAARNCARRWPMSSWPNIRSAPASSPGPLGRRTARRHCRRTSTIPPSARSTFDQVDAGLLRTGARACGWRSRLSARRDHLRHAQRKSRALRDSEALRRHGRQASGHGSVTITDNSGRTLSGPDGRSLLEFRFAPRPCSASASTARSAEANAALYRGALALAPIYVSCYPNAGLPIRFRRPAFTRRPKRWRRNSASSPRTAGSTSSADAAARRPSTSAPSPRRSRIAASRDSDARTLHAA